MITIESSGQYINPRKSEPQEGEYNSAEIINFAELSQQTASYLNNWTPESAEIDLIAITPFQRQFYPAAGTGHALDYNGYPINVFTQELTWVDKESHKLRRQVRQKFHEVLLLGQNLPGYVAQCFLEQNTQRRILTAAKGIITDYELSRLDLYGNLPDRNTQAGLLSPTDDSYFYAAKYKNREHFAAISCSREYKQFLQTNPAVKNTFAVFSGAISTYIEEIFTLAIPQLRSQQLKSLLQVITPEYKSPNFLDICPQFVFVQLNQMGAIETESGAIIEKSKLESVLQSTFATMRADGLFEHSKVVNGSITTNICPFGRNAAQSEKLTLSTTNEMPQNILQYFYEQLEINPELI